MKLTFFCLSILAQGIIAGPLFASEVKVCDHLSEIFAVTSPELGEKVERGNLGGRKACIAKWDQTRKRYCEIILPPSLLIFNPGRAKLSANFYFPPGNAIHGICMRFHDAEGETFQLRHHIPPNTENWREIIWNIDTECPPNENWGKKKNGKIDFPCKVSGFSIEYVTKQAVSFLGFEGFKLKTCTKEIQSSLQTGTSVNVLCQGRENKFSIRLINGFMHQNIDFSCGLLDRTGKEIGRVSRKFLLKPGEIRDIPLPAPKQYGSYTAEWKINEKKEIRRFAYIHPAGPGQKWMDGDFVFGVASHPERRSWSDQAKEAEAAGLCGVKVLRMDYLWGHFNPSVDKWTFEAGDRRKKLFAKHGIRIAPILGTYTHWGRDATWTPANPSYTAVYRGRPDFKHYRNFIRKLLTHYKGQMDFIELCNEPDLAGALNITSDDYAAMARILYEEARAIDPSYRILTGGFAVFEAEPGKSAEPKMMQNCIRKTLGFYDHFAFHGHGPFEHFRSQVEKHIRFRCSIGDNRKWYANETAISATGNSERTQSETLFKKLLYSWANNAMGYNWYDLRNDGKDPKNAEHNYGLFTYDFEPKEPFVTFNMLAWKFRKARYIRPIASRDRCYLWLFHAENGDWLIPGWGQKPSCQIYFVQGGSPRVSELDLFGNRKPLRLHDNIAPLILYGESPRLFEFGKQDQAPTVFSKPYLDIPQRIPQDEENKGGVTFPVYNPLSFKLKTTWHVEDQGKKIASGISELKEGEYGSIHFQLGKSKIQTLVLQNEQWGTIRFPIKISKPHTLLHEYREWADFSLNRPSQVVPLMIQTPETAHLFWSGPDDLSVKLWGAAKKDELCFKIRCKDDKHVPVDNPDMMWKGDSVQLALKKLDGGGMWNIGLALTSSGKPSVWVWQAIKGASSGRYDAFKLKASRNDAAQETFYEVSLPYKALKLKPGESFLFNFLVNDNDHGVRESYLEFAPGLGALLEPQAESSVLLRLPEQ